MAASTGKGAPSEEAATMTITRSLQIAAALAVFVSAGGALAQTVPLEKPKVLTSGVDKPASILWAGNSFFYYNNSLHGHFNQLMASADPTYKLRQTSVTISGAGIDWHDMASYFRPKAIGNYSFDPQNNVVFNKIERLFDLAVVMDCSQCPIHPTLGPVFTEYAKKNADIIRANGGKPVYFMSWAYADKPEMTAQLANAYIKAANDNGGFVIPVGLAFSASIAKKPTLNLYAPDKRHPSLAGTYLAAVTSYAALMGKSPVGLKYDAGLGAETAAHLQQVAQETVSAFFGR
jgi:hypothetical protein